MTDLATLAGTPPARPEPERDRWGRYKLTHPETGKVQPWTRATTFASSIADTYGLDQWRKRMVAFGIAHRADLHAEAASITDPDNAKEQLGRIAEAAMEAAGASSKARLGTAMHAFCEAHDHGNDAAIPDQYRADVNAYAAALAAHRVEIIPDYIERIVTVPDIDVAGTFDRIVRIDGQLYIADLKTGRDLSYSWHEIAIQLAIYSRAATIYDAATGAHTPMPAVAQDRALVMHLPVGAATCTLYWVDLTAGAEAIELCSAVRTWRKRRDLSTPLAAADGLPAEPEFHDDNEPVHVAEALTEAVHALGDRTAWLTGRIDALRGNEAAMQATRLAWPADLPATAPWTPDQQDQVVAALAAGEAAIRAPFPAPDPAAEAARAEAVEAARIDPPSPPRVPQRDLDDGGSVTLSVCLAMRDEVRALDKPQRAQLAGWLAEGQRGGHDFAPVPNDKPWSVRTYARVVAAHACTVALHGPDEPDALTRAALRLVLGDDAVQPAFPTGALIGSLDADQARQLTQIAVAFRDGDTATTARLTAVVVAA